MVCVVAQGGQHPRCWPTFPLSLHGSLPVPWIPWQETHQEFLCAILLFSGLVDNLGAHLSPVQCTLFRGTQNSSPVFCLLMFLNTSLGPVPGKFSTKIDAYTGQASEMQWILTCCCCCGQCCSPHQSGCTRTEHTRRCLTLGGGWLAG